MAAAARETSLANSRGVSWAVGNNMAVLLADTLVAVAVPPVHQQARPEPQLSVRPARRLD